MNCQDTQQLLSAFCDDELAADVRECVSEHIAKCNLCAKALSGFQQLSRVAGTLESPVPPEQIWSQVAQQLDTVEPTQVATVHAWSATRSVALAAMLLIAVGSAWTIYATLSSLGDHDEFTQEFGHYLDEFERDPEMAQQFLLGKYEHDLVSPVNAVEQVGYRPVVADDLPRGYTMKLTHVMKMPCCTCVQTLCERSDGSTLAIFEHNDDNMREWFGERPESTAECCERSCSVVQLNHRIAASWKRDKRYITVVGLRDVDELERFVAWFDGQG